MEGFDKIRIFRRSGPDGRLEYYSTEDRTYKEPILEDQIVRVVDAGDSETIHKNIMFRVIRLEDGGTELRLLDAESAGRQAWWMDKPLNVVDLSRLTFDLSNRGD